MESANGSISSAHDGGAGSGGHSSRVRLFLRVGGRVLEAAEVGHDRVWFDEPIMIEPGPAEVIVEIDGESTSRAVMVDGCNEASVEVAVSDFA